MILSRIYPEMKDYGFNRLIREYAVFPSFLPLACHWEHGWIPGEVPLYSDLQTSRPLMLVFSLRRKYVWETRSKIKVVVGGSFFINYRRHKKIKISQKAEGTISFPSHSTNLINAEFDIDEYCAQLSKIHKMFKPVSICLHQEDIKNGKDKKYKKHGFKVVSAGDTMSENFVDRYYKILRGYKYATSNTPGSYMLYSVEMGMPFFLLGDAPKMINYGKDPNVPRKYSIFDYRYAKIARELFVYDSKRSLKISSRQRKFIEEESGINVCISPSRLRRELYQALIKDVAEVIIKKIASILIRCLGKASHLWYFLINGLIFESIISTHLTTEEKITLNRLSKSLKAKSVVVEIGSYLGASSCFIAKGIDKTSKLYCIDTWGNHSMIYSDDDRKDVNLHERDTLHIFKNNTKKFKNKIIILRGWSSEMIGYLIKKEDTINMLFIDGDHKYKGVKDDWNYYAPLLAKGAYIIFHDTGWAEDVKKVIKEDVIKVAKILIRLPNMEIYKKT